MISITNKKFCSGCSACFSICPQNCIELKEDEDGFLYPHVNQQLCIQCELCDKACPFKSDFLMPYPRQTFACKSLNKDIKLKSSSGGIFTLLANNVLNNNGVVFGASFNEKFGVEHIMIDNTNDLPKLRGSKYVQSVMGNTYANTKNQLNAGKQVLFSGTACQIAGLKAYLGKEHDNLLCVDVVCHGTPSPKVFSSYLTSLSKKRGKLKAISFRDKRLGWIKFRFKIEFENSTIDNYHIDDPYMQGFLQNLTLRPSCFHCRTRMSGSDLSLADYWGIQRKYPNFYDPDGVSLVIINTKKGKQIFDYITNEIEAIETDYSYAKQGNYCIEKSVSPHPKREEFFYEFSKDPTEVINLLKKHLNITTISMLKRKIHSFLGKIKRFISRG